MKIGIVQASSQINKNSIIYESVKEYAKGHEVINFGCTDDDKYEFSYIEAAFWVGLLLASGSIDFAVTGCSSGQGMMLACNSMPKVICGYAPTPKDAFLFAQINNGNAISFPLGENYTYMGEENLRQTVKMLFSEPFGQGYPKGEATHKLQDTALLKNIRSRSQLGFTLFLERLDKEFIKKALRKENVIRYTIENGTDQELIELLKQYI